MLRFGWRSGALCSRMVADTLEVDRCEGMFGNGADLICGVLALLRFY